MITFTKIPENNNFTAFWLSLWFSNFSEKMLEEGHNEATLRLQYVR